MSERITDEVTLRRQVVDAPKTDLFDALAHRAVSVEPSTADV